jgi:hypothetical protein
MMQLVDVVRSANEECQNLLDSKPSLTSVTEGILMPDGKTLASIACKRSKTGKITVTIRAQALTLEAAKDETP